MQLRTILLVLASLAFLSASVGGYLYYSSLRESAFREAETKGTLHAEEIRNQIASNLAGNQKAVRALAGLKELQRALLSPNKDSLVEANSVLDHFYRVLECSVCYLMDSAGNTIAASKELLFSPLFSEGYKRHSRRVYGVRSCLKKAWSLL